MSNLAFFEMYGLGLPKNIQATAPKLRGPALRDTARLSQQFTRIRRMGFWVLQCEEILGNVNGFFSNGVFEVWKAKTSPTPPQPPLQPFPNPSPTLPQPLSNPPRNQITKNLFEKPVNVL